MKKFKISVLALAAMILAIAGSAFTVKENSTRTNGWFIFAENGEIDNVASYEYYDGEVPCEGDNKPCAIFGERDVNDMSRPTPASLEYALDQSDNLDHAVTGIVAFKE